MLVIFAESFLGLLPTLELFYFARKTFFILFIVFSVSGRTLNGRIKKLSLLLTSYRSPKNTIKRIKMFFAKKSLKEVREEVEASFSVKSLQACIISIWWIF